MIMIINLLYRGLCYIFEKNLFKRYNFLIKVSINKMRLIDLFIFINLYCLLQLEELEIQLFMI